MEAIVGLGGFVAAPVTPMPTASPVVLRHVTDVLAVPVVQPVSVTPAAVSDSPVPFPDAAWLITNVVLSVIETMVVATVVGVVTFVPTIFVPVINMPGINPVVLVQVTVVVPFVAPFASTIAAVRFPVPPRSRASAAARLAVAFHAFMFPGSAKLVPVPVNEPLLKISRNAGPVLCAPAL